MATIACAIQTNFHKGQVPRYAASSAVASDIKNEAVTVDI